MNKSARRRATHPIAIRLAAFLAVPLLLTGCSGGDIPDQPATPADDAPTVPDTPVTESTTTETTTTTATATKANHVPEAKELFGSLAPDSLWDQFENCNAPTRDTMECSGEAVGQFQFFDSAAKAATSAQLLTELRSSKVIHSAGNVLVGWSVFGTSALITVVDTDKGQVMQQLYGSERGEPDEHIYELGLATPTSSTSGSSAASASSSATSTAEPTEETQGAEAAPAKR